MQAALRRHGHVRPSSRPPARPLRGTPPDGRRPAVAQWRDTSLRRPGAWLMAAALVGLVALTISTDLVVLGPALLGALYVALGHHGSGIAVGPDWIASRALGVSWVDTSALTAVKVRPLPTGLWLHLRDDRRKLALRLPELVEDPAVWTEVRAQVLRSLDRGVVVDPFTAGVLAGGSWDDGAAAVRQARRAAGRRFTWPERFSWPEQR